jgi:TonB-linked SusC/RagA family outer membrane protein
MRKITMMLAFLLFAGLNFALAQTRTISGTVTSADDGSALPGVTVVVKGTTNNGTVTDANGKYSLQVGPNAKTLVFSFVGMQTQEIAIDGKTTINVVMKSSALSLNQVVVTALGISRQKRALGYSVTKVSSAEISKTAVTDAVNALAGKVAGVRITNSSGAAGAAPFVEIRGSSSILGNNQPLYVVDGVPIASGGGAGGVAGVAHSSRTIDINPDDIASISVLKGGAATALYGLRAANGAIIITTKKGKKQKGLNITYNTSTKIEKISQVPALQDKYGQGSALLAQYGWDPYPDPDNPHYNGVSWGAALDTLRYTTDPNYNPANYYWAAGSTPMDLYMKYWDPNGRIVGEHSPFASNKKVKPYDRYAFFQTGVSLYNNVAVSGGNDKTTFYVSLSNTHTKGVVPNNTLDRTTFSLNASHKPAKNLKVSGVLNYANTYANRKQQGSNLDGVMLGLLRTPPTFDDSYGYIFTGTYRHGQQRTYRNGGGYDNPYWVANKINYRDEVNRLFGTFTTEWDITRWLKLTYRGGLDYYNYYATNDFAIHSAGYPEGYASNTQHFRMDLNQDIFANVNVHFTKDFGMQAMVGWNMYQHRYKSVSSEANGLIIPDFYNVANTNDVKGYQGEASYRTRAYYYDVSFSYKNMLYVDATGRYEGSTTLPENNNSFFYPSVSASWVFSQLPGLKDSKALSFAKLRASYAVTANVPGAYTTENYFYQGGAGDGWTNGVSFPFLGVNGYTVGYTLHSDNLKPEKSKEWSVGGDFRFDGSRFRVDVDYFHRINSDLLLNVPSAPSIGFGQRYINAAEMKTTGLELLVSADVIKTKTVLWNVTLNWSNPSSVVTKLAPGVPNVFLGGFTEPQVRAVAGEKYRTIYGLDWVRDDKGNLIINDDPNDEFYGYPIPASATSKIGSVQPDWTMGITNTLTVKGFSLSFLIDIKHGGQMWNGTLGALDFFGTSGETADRDKDYVWKGVMGHVDPTTGKVVVTGGQNTQKVKLDENWRWWDGYGSGFTGPSSPYVQDAGWVRLRTITLSYDFKKAVLKNVNWIKHLDFYVTGYNLWLSTPYTGIDPETSLLGASNAQGFDYFNMPGTKSYTFGLKVGF